MKIHNEQEHGPVKVSTYLNVFYLLIGLTILTLAQPVIVDLDLGSTLAVQLSIALAKSLLIVAYYMHIKSEVSTFKVLIVGSLCIMAIFYIIMAIDTYYRYTPNDLFQ